MRFKIVLVVRNEAFGNILPVSYQFELSSCIYKKLTENKKEYNEWLEMNGFIADNNIKHKLFSLSNFYIPKIKVEEDRLHVLARKVQFWISFLPERGTAEFIKKILTNQVLLIGDRKTQVEFVTESIEEINKVDFPKSIDYLSLSPIVVSSLRQNKSVEYISPEDLNYSQTLMNILLDKYRHFYGHDFPHQPDYSFELLSTPKRKGIFIKRFTEEETKIIGYMYKFRFKAHPALHHLIYNTGLGDKVGLGFGCVEILNT
ncbi:MAG: CRISPR-associated endoribonuclease Cas6 [Bacteroidales bacterium]